MNLLGVQLQLMIGPTIPIPVPRKVVEALESVEVTHSDEGRSAFQLRFRVTYSGAMHAFSVPGVDSPDHGAQYQDRAERRSWRALTDFLAEHLG